MRPTQVIRGKLPIKILNSIESVKSLKPRRMTQAQMPGIGVWASLWDGLILHYLKRAALSSW